jgi:hypothetical protein
VVGFTLRPLYLRCLIGWEAGWTLEPVWMTWSGESLAAAGTSGPDTLASQPVEIAKYMTLSRAMIIVRGPAGKHDGL